jgi:aspartate aminotransferase
LQVARMLEEYKKRRDYVVDRLNGMEGVQCERPAGAFYVFPNIEGGLGFTTTANTYYELPQMTCQRF